MVLDSHQQISDHAGIEPESENINAKITQGFATGSLLLNQSHLNTINRINQVDLKQLCMTFDITVYESLLYFP